MKLVSVYRTHYTHCREVADILQCAGLHPVFDDGPRWVTLNDFSSTPILVPENEAEQAREILSKWWADSQGRISVYVRGWWWRPVVVPLLIAGAIGVLVGVITGQFFNGLAAFVLAFIWTVQLIGTGSRSGQNKARMLKAPPP
jgi:hypothetical protein